MTSRLKKNRLIEDHDRLKEELKTLHNSSTWREKEHQYISAKTVDSTSSSVVLLPGAYPTSYEENDIEVVRLPELQVPTKGLEIPSGPLPSMTIQDGSPNHGTSFSPQQQSSQPPTPVKPFASGDGQCLPEAVSSVIRRSGTQSSGRPQKKPSAKQRRSLLFPDTEELKTQVREALSGKPQYRVSDLYHATGFCQRLATSQIFENVTFLVIFAVCIWIAIDTDLNTASTLPDADATFQIASNLFCAYFTFELTVRFGAFERKQDCLKDFSFLFDTLLVVQDVLETWILSLYVALSSSGQGSPAKFGIFRVLRMAKLFRMARAVRLMRAMPEIAILVKGIGIATRSVFFTLFLLMLIIYVFAVVFRQLTDGTEIGDQYFKDVAHAMNSLLLDGVLPDNAAIVNDLAGQSWYLWPLIMFFILLASLTVMNMLVGVLVEVVGQVAAAEKEGLAVHEMREQLAEVMSSLDFDQSGCISKAEFDKILVQPEAAKILSDVGVDVVGLVDLSDFVFEDFGADGELDFEEFMKVVLDLRETNTAKVKDVVMLQKLMKRDMRTTYNHIIKNMLTILTTPGATVEERIKNFNAIDGPDHHITHVSLQGMHENDTLKGEKRHRTSMMCDSTSMMCDSDE